MTTFYFIVLGANLFATASKTLQLSFYPVWNKYVDHKIAFDKREKQ